MTATNCPVLLAGRDSTTYVVRVVGRGTLRESPTLLAFGEHCFADSPAELVVDLSDCEYLDSSFLGTLVALHRAAPAAGQFQIVADPAVRRRLLSAARLDQLLDCRSPAGEYAAIDFAELPTARMNLEQTARHALLVHRRLAGVDGPHAEQCGQVADRLQQELGAPADNSHGYAANKTNELGKYDDD